MSVSRRDGWHEPSFCESRWLWLAAEADEVVSPGNNDPRSFMREGQGRGTSDAGECASDKYCGSVHVIFLSLWTDD
jgi:hypothetical protein